MPIHKVFKRSTRIAATIASILRTPKIPIIFAFRSIIYSANFGYFPTDFNFNFFRYPENIKIIKNSEYAISQPKSFYAHITLLFSAQNKIMHSSKIYAMLLHGHYTMIIRKAFLLNLFSKLTHI